MTRAAAIRRLALDINPWVRVWVGVILLSVVLIDYHWLGFGSVQPMTSGAIFCVLASFAAQKVPLWRILPVSAVEIDRARWWQGIATPALLSCLIGAGTALALALRGHLRIAWPDIAMGIATQAAFNVLLAGVIFVGFPLVSQKLGRASVLLLVLVIIGMAGLGALRLIWRDTRDIFLIFDGLGFGTAIALYRGAGRWPAPMTTASWDMPPGSPAPSNAAEKSSGLRGWPVLIQGSLPAFAAAWAVVAGIPVAMAYVLRHMDVRIMGLILCIMPMQWAVSGLATALRSLRAMPLTAWQLTGRVALLLLLVQGISLACLELADIVTAQADPPVLFAAMLAYPLFYFPFVLRFPRLMQFGVGLSIFYTIPFQFLVFYPHAAFWIAAGSLAAMVLGVLWIRREIINGPRAYQVQPLVPARWRGFHR